MMVYINAQYIPSKEGDKLRRSGALGTDTQRVRNGSNDPWFPRWGSDPRMTDSKSAAFTTWLLGNIWDPG